MAVRFRVPLKAQMLDKNYLLVKASDDKPITKEYANTSEKLFIKQYGTQNNPVNIHYYNTEFSPALPPMSTRQEPMALPMNAADTLHYSTGDTIKFNKEGLYVLEPSSAFAKSLLVQKGAYPQITMAQELLQPLIYITTSTEREALFRTSNPKEAVDNFWLKVAGDKATARELIRTYYSRVERANKLFTCHKPGWTSDRGMIYIVFGKPSTMSQTGNTETWIYREAEASPYIKFVFNKKGDNFTENHYELVRHRDYEESWYSTVAKWRAGITDNL
ncbi:GWxTD domain-containing protein [Pontibacter sp. SD6]|uniref:GWxTD domain-containing protein n=2 Tax=Pontibacter cellulosilyticus TaxID=1720253 RepID=A0A923SIT0_9BACT|nr:GWxTD domain-containing protein [Pontibacter cellulosilyticus]